jgi:hypothetical protein
MFNVLVFGRRQRRDARQTELAGVQKAPRHEVAGSMAPGSAARLRERQFPTGRLVEIDVIAARVWMRLSEIVFAIHLHRNQARGPISKIDFQIDRIAVVASRIVPARIRVGNRALDHSVDSCVQPRLPLAVPSEFESLNGKLRRAAVRSSGSENPAETNSPRRRPHVAYRQKSQSLPGLLGKALRFCRGASRIARMYPFDLRLSQSCSLIVGQRIAQPGVSLAERFVGAARFGVRADRSFRRACRRPAVNREGWMREQNPRSGKP